MSYRRRYGYSRFYGLHRRFNGAAPPVLQLVHHIFGGAQIFALPHRVIIFALFHDRIIFRAQLFGGLNAVFDVIADIFQNDERCVAGNDAVAFTQRLDVLAVGLVVYVQFADLFLRP